VPFVQYVTFVVDNKVVAWRARQRVNGSHSVTSLDTVPVVDKMTTTPIESVAILPEDSARLFDRCAGVRVVSIHRKRRDR
jgi:hypothetical protein